MLCDIELHDMKARRKDKSIPVSKYKCVSWSKIPKSWHGSIRHKGRHIYVKQSRSEVEVALAINEKCRELRIPLKNPSVEAYRKEPFEISEKIDTDSSTEDSERKKVASSNILCVYVFPILYFKKQKIGIKQAQT